MDKYAIIKHNTFTFNTDIIIINKTIDKKKIKYPLIVNLLLESEWYIYCNNEEIHVASVYFHYLCHDGGDYIVLQSIDNKYIDIFLNLITFIKINNIRNNSLEHINTYNIININQLNTLLYETNYETKL